MRARRMAARSRSRLIRYRPRPIPLTWRASDRRPRGHLDVSASTFDRAAQPCNPVIDGTLRRQDAASRASSTPSRISMRPIEDIDSAISSSSNSRRRRRYHIPQRRHTCMGLLGRGNLQLREFQDAYGYAHCLDSAAGDWAGLPCAQDNMTARSTSTMPASCAMPAPAEINAFLWLPARACRRPDLQPRRASRADHGFLEHCLRIPRAVDSMRL